MKSQDLISVIQEGFQAQIKMILDKLSDVEDKLYGSSPYTEREVQQTTPVVQFHQTQQSFLQAQANFQHAHPNDTTDGHPLMSKSPLKGARKQDQDCILIFESRASTANQEAASRLLLPPNFYNYTKRDTCPGCIGCRGLPRKTAKFIKQEDEEIKLVSTTLAASESVVKPV